MSFYGVQETGRPIAVKDEGVVLNSNVSSIDFAGAGVTGTNVGPAVTESIPGGGGASPLTTKGDVFGFSTVAARIPVGTDGFALVADSVQALGVKWASVSGSGITRSINSISTPQTALAATVTDYVYLVSGTTTLTLPTAIGNTNRYTVKNTGVATVTIATTSAQTIDGSASATLSVQNTSLELISDNANWQII